MSKKILSIIITLTLIIGILPINTKAAEAVEQKTPTRTQEKPIALSTTAAGNESEGWQWTPDASGGGTLELTNCYIQSSTTSIFRFQDIETENRKINIILRGENILKTTSNEYAPLISANGQSNLDYTIMAEEEGSLEIGTESPVTSGDIYGFAGKSINIQSGNIKSNIIFCIIREDFSIQNGSLEIHTPEDVNNIDGIYTLNGPVNINGGTVDIDVSNIGIFIPGNVYAAGKQIINITGGNINIKAGFSCIHINKKDPEDEQQQEQSINISGGNITCYGEQTTLYAKRINIVKGDDTNLAPKINVSNGTKSEYPAIFPSSKKITVSGSIVIADKWIYGYDQPDSQIENSIIIDGTQGKVHGEVEITENLTVPENTTLSIPDNATLSIPEDIILTVPDSVKLQVETDGKLINNGTLILPEDSDEILCTGSGVIKKGDNLYTNNNERLYKLTLIQKDGQITEYHIQDESIELQPEQAAAGMKFKEWKVTPDTVTITDNKFIMPATDIIIEAVYEKIPIVTNTPAPTKEPIPTEEPISTEEPTPTESVEPVVSMTPSPNGNIIVTEPVIAEDTPHTYTESTQDEIKEAVPLTAEEQAEVKNGSDIKIYLKVEKKTVTQEEKQIIDNEKKDYEIGEYIDISMFKQIDGKEASPVTQLNKKIVISFIVPENLRNKNNSFIRIYEIICHHFGESSAEILQGTYNEQTFTFTFETDRFSTYAIAYKDTAKQTNNNPSSIFIGGSGGYTTDYTHTASPSPSTTPTPVPTAAPTQIPTATLTAQPDSTAHPSQTPTASVVPTQKPVPDNNDSTPAPSKPSDETTNADNTLTLNAKFKVTQTNNKIKVLYGEVSEANGYDVYIQYCGKKFNNSPSNSVKNGKMTKINIKTINGKKINLKKSYKLYVTAYKFINNKKVVLGKSIIAHNAGIKNKKYTNAKNIEVKKASYSLKKGKTAKINASTILVDKNKKLLSDNHAKEFRYTTSDKSIATVSLSGKIRAVRKGSCIIYVYAKNGNAKEIKVNVKL